MWGYKIKKQVAEKFDVKLGHGGLYPLLRSLEEEGFITSQKQQQKGRTRKTYTITQKGKEYIDAYESILKEQIHEQG
jgi:PadR family transcriptional regulator PadR